MMSAVKPKRWPELLSFARLLGRAEDGDAGVTIPHVTAAEIHRLGDDLYAIAMGKDASHVFQQFGGRGNQSDGVLQWNRSLAYWHARAIGKSVDDAVAVAQCRYRYVIPPSKQAMIRYARKYRDRAFDVLERTVDLTEIKKQLAQRSRRGRE